MIKLYSTMPAFSQETKEKSELNSIFLVGPTPRSASVQSWRPEAVEILERLNYGGYVLIPEWESGAPKSNYDNQVEWERQGLHNCDVIVAWVPRDMATMPALTTNVEFGYWMAKNPLKVIYGRPDSAFSIRYLDWLYKLSTNKEPFNTLESTLQAAVALCREPKTFVWKRNV